MRCIPALATGKPHRWSHISEQLRITPQTARRWHAAGLAEIAARLLSQPPPPQENATMTSQPRTEVFIDGIPAAEYEAALAMNPGRPIVTETGDDRVRRLVARGKTLQWEGIEHQAGAVVHLPAARANALTRDGTVVHPQDFDRSAGRAVTITTQAGAAARPPFQGPAYDRR
jgi:hypothetical protein